MRASNIAKLQKKPQMTQRRFTTGFAALVVTACAAATGLASGSAPSGVTFQGAVSVVARGGGNTATLGIPLSEFVWDGEVYHYQLPAQFDLVDDDTGMQFAVLRELLVEFEYTPLYRLTLSTSVLSGPTTTEFEIDTPAMRFPAVQASVAEGRATGGVTITDVDLNFAQIASLGPAGSGIIRAHYVNVFDQPATFSELVAFALATNGGTGSGSQLDPPVGFRPIANGIREVSGAFRFSLTANDLGFASLTWTATAPFNPCPADIDGNGQIDTSDLVVLVSLFGACADDPEFEPNADIDGDGCITSSDLALLLDDLGAACDDASSPDEPAPPRDAGHSTAGSGQQ